MDYKKILRIIILIIAIAVFAFSAYKIFDYFYQGNQSSSVTSDLIKDAVTVNIVPSEGSSDGDTVDAPDTPPLIIDFEKLQNQNSDIAAWLYCEDTPINYPIMAGDDNSYYLNHLADKTTNRAGSLFLDYRGSSDFSDFNSIIYGHNMKNNSMFGTLNDYKKQEYYDSHPIMYLFTPQGCYKVKLFAGFTINASDELYSTVGEQDFRDDIINRVLKKSTFESDVQVNDGDRIISLSTCSYAYDDARYVLLGVLERVYY